MNESQSSETMTIMSNLLGARLHIMNVGSTCYIFSGIFFFDKFRSVYYPGYKPFADVNPVQVFYTKQHFSLASKCLNKLVLWSRNSLEENIQKQFVDKALTNTVYSIHLTLSENSYTCKVSTGQPTMTILEVVIRILIYIFN